MTCAKRWWWTAAAAVAAALALAGCSQSSEQYSQDLSSELPKPRADGPDFGEFKQTSPSPNGGGRAGR